jgi:hypothetical protein
MGFAPPEDAPPPEEQEQEAVEAGFQPSPTGATVCGFGFPIFVFDLNIFVAFPSFEFPTFDFFVQLNCDLSNPIDADFEFGGGRVGQSDVDSDDELKD